MALFKNVTGQKIAVYAHDTSADAPKTGDAANITAQISLDFGAAAATNDTNPTELDATDHPGIYVFTLTQAETNAEAIVISAVSATADISIEPVQVFTTPVYNDPTAAAIRTEMDNNSTQLALILNEVQYPDGWVYIDTTGGSAGSTLGTHGTLRNPVDNLGDAITLATALGSYRIKEVGPGTSVSSLTIASVDLTGFIIDLNGARWTFGSSVTTFYTTWMNGELAGSTIAGGTPVKMDVGDRFINVLVYNVLSISGSGILERCTIADGLHLASGSVDVACTEMLTTGNTSIDFNSLSGTIRLHGINGDATVKNMTGGTLCYYGRGQVTLEASCTGGTLAHTSDVKITNGGTTTTSLVTSGATNASIADAVLDEAMSGHETNGTLGKTVSDILVDTGTDGVVVAAASKTGYALSASGVDAILDEAIAEPSGMFAWGSATLRNIIGVLGALLRNKVTSDSNSVDVRNDDDDATLWSYATSDDDTTFTSGEGT